MITAKTTALVAAMALLGTVAPAAFAQTFIIPVQDNDENDEVNADQSNSFTANIAQSQNQEAYGTNYGDYGEVEIEQNADQGFCLQANQQNAAAGRDAINAASNSISADADNDADDDSDFNDQEAEASVDCS